MSPKRRDLVRAGIALGCGSLAGCSGLLSGSGSDPAEEPGGNGGGPGDRQRALGWLPAPETVVTHPNPPALTVRPGALFEDDHRIDDGVLTFAQRLVNRYFPANVDVRELDAVASGPAATVGTGTYHRETVRARLEDNGYAQVDERDGFVVYGGDRTAFALGDGVFIVGRGTPTTDAGGVIDSAIAAGNGEEGYVAGTGIGPVADDLSSAAFGILVPVDGPETAVPDRGLFPAERGWGHGVTPDGEETTYRVVRAFDGEVPREGVRQWADTSPTFESDRAVVSETGETADLSLSTLAASARETMAREPGIERTNGRVDTVYVHAARYLFSPLTLDEVTVQADQPVTFEIASTDVIHGVAISDTVAERTLVPGETARITTTFEEPGTKTIQCTRYCGVGHEAMTAEFEVVDPDAPPYQEYLEDANNYDGTVADRRGSAEVTVDVGAGNGLAFDPVAVRISPGTTVTWEWTGEGGSHSVVAEDGTFDSGTPVSDGQFSYTFRESGVTRYHCLPHQGSGMLGIIDVE